MSAESDMFFEQQFCGGANASLVFPQQEHMNGSPFSTTAPERHEGIQRAEIRQACRSRRHQLLAIRQAARSTVKSSVDQLPVRPSS